VSQEGWAGRDEEGGRAAVGKSERASLAPGPPATRAQEPSHPPLGFPRPLPHPVLTCCM
jgi:hypothetical protein